MRRAHVPESPVPSSSFFCPSVIRAAPLYALAPKGKGTAWQRCLTYVLQRFRRLRGHRVNPTLQPRARRYLDNVRRVNADVEAQHKRNAGRFDFVLLPPLGDKAGIGPASVAIVSRAVVPLLRARQCMLLSNKRFLRCALGWHVGRRGQKKPCSAKALVTNVRDSDSAFSSHLAKNAWGWL